MLWAGAISWGQTGGGRLSCGSAVQQHYDAAERLQASGDRHQAEFEFKLFVAEGLRCVAVDRAATGEYTAAVPLFERAIKLAPNDVDARLDFAAAAAGARDFARAKEQAQGVADAAGKGCAGAVCARANALLGRALFGEGDMQGARDAYESAVRSEPSFDHGYALAKTYLAQANTKAAASLFAEMLASYGDRPEIHMEFGRAYGEAEFPEQAIVEFNKALTQDSSFPEVHYCLGASYLMRSGNTAFALAEAEFHKELALHPDDAFSYSQLGYIAMSRHDLKQAEADLSRAAALDSHNPDNFLLLGQIYGDLGRGAEAETALRSAIAATTDPSRNHYQIRGAHFQLGRLLMQRGERREAGKEMAAAEDLLLQNRMQDQVNYRGKPVAGYRFPVAASGAAADSKMQTGAREYERRLAPALADGYSNLGVTAASDKRFPEALGFFEQAAAWNPQTEALDYNWGRAAFAAKQYRQAAVCLGRVLEANPVAAGVREPLGMSRFLIQDYAGAVSALAPLRARLGDTPLLAYAYAESLLETGAFEDGAERMRALEAFDPASGLFPLALGRALLRRGEFAEGARELTKAVRQRPGDREAKYQLASALFELKREPEGQALLAQLAEPPARGGEADNPEVYRRIAILQAKHGNAQWAVANLEMAARLSPESAAISGDLAAAYEKNGREQDAAREMSRYKARETGLKAP